MEAVTNRPLFTELYENPSDFQPKEGSAYIYGVFEERSLLVDGWAGRANDVAFARIEELERPLSRYEPFGGEILSMRDRSCVVRMLSIFDARLLYIDITGLSHHIWAPLIRVAIEEGLAFKVVYIEPGDYTFSGNPIRGEIFDLSLKLEGIAPLPLFTRVFPTNEDECCFIPLLGFEGARLAHMIEKVDPPGRQIVPVLGVPGFRAEYPFYAFAGNEPKLTETRAWHRVRYARANCPFSLLYVLEDIFARYRNIPIKIAPIGTKPHALGAVITCVISPRDTELVYDNPKRKPGRTAGVLHCLIYSVSNFLSGYDGPAV